MDSQTISPSQACMNEPISTSDQYSISNETLDLNAHLARHLEGPCRAGHSHHVLMKKSEFLSHQENFPMLTTTATSKTSTSTSSTTAEGICAGTATSWGASERHCWLILLVVEQVVGKKIWCC
jgi:hypothetical protein